MGIVAKSDNFSDCRSSVRISGSAVTVLANLCGIRWEWPPAVCGKHTNVVSLDKPKRWCMVAYRAFDKLMQLLPAEHHGVRMRMSNLFFSKPLEQMPGQLEKMREIESNGEVCVHLFSSVQ